MYRRFNSILDPSTRFGLLGLLRFVILDNVTLFLSIEERIDMIS